MATNGNGYKTGYTPLGSSLRDYMTSVRTGYKAARDAKKTRMEAVKDAKAAGKTAWATDKATMQKEGYLRKKKNGNGTGNGQGDTVSLPQDVMKPTAAVPTTGGFKVY